MTYATGSMTEHVLKELKDTTGLYLPGRPEGDIPALPVDITDLSDEDLMILYSDFIAWSDYAASQLAVASAEEREHMRLHDLQKARSIAAPTDGSVTAARARAEDDASSSGYAASERYAYRKVLEAVAGNMDRDAALLSRELSRRLGEKPSVMKRRGWGP